MNWLKRLFARRRLYGDLSEEIRVHLDERTEELVSGGMPREEAAAAARREFGNVGLIEEDSRTVWRWPSVENFIRDIRYALRMLVKNPGFTAVAVTALALGIGVNTAIYTIVNGALSWDMGLDNRDRIIWITSTNAAHSEDWETSYPDFRDFRSQTKSLAGLGAYTFAPVNLSDSTGLPERYYSAQMSANAFAVVGQKPLLGRGFIAGDEQPGAPAVLIIAYHVWRDRYASDPAIIGRSVRIDEIPRVVIGVMPPGRRFPEETDLWTPLVPDASLEKRDNRDLTVFGRLRDGVALPSARAEFTAMSQNLAAQYPNTNKDVTTEVRPIEQITGLYFMKPLILAIFGAVGFVLLIACADVANMLLARATERSREISIRVAIGAGRIPIIRQLLVESVVLSVTGGLLGCLVAVAGLKWFDSGMGTMEKPIWLHLSLDRSALLYLAAISVGVGILFGLAPALQLAKTDANAALKEGGGHGVVGNKFGLRLSSVLVGIQMALCVVLLVGAGLMIHGAVNMYSTPIGVNTKSVLTMRINLPEAKYPKPESWIAFHEDLKKRLAALPGVELASVSSNMPLGGWIPFSLEFDGRSNDATQLPEVGCLVVGNNYFQTMQIEPRRGRLFVDADGVAGPPVAVVNESFAAKYWPGEEPLGKRIRVMDENLPGAWLTVVGVVPDVLQNFRQTLERDPLIYVPFAEKPQRQTFLVARTGVPPASLSDPFRREVQRIDDNLAVYEVRTLENRIAESRLGVSLFGGIYSVFAGVATLLAAVGLYAVIAHSVNQRRREIGLRMALGATRRDIMRLVFAQGIKPLVPGLAIGLLLALGVKRALPAEVVGVSSGDPVTFIAAIFVLLLAALLGCVVPARRAMRVDPMIALRCE